MLEEEIIYELIDCIIRNQDKISELSMKIEFPSNDDVYQKEVFYRNKLNKNIQKISEHEKNKKINEKNLKKYITDYKLKSDEIEDKLSKINNKLTEIENEADNDDNPNKEFYKTSYEKVKNIILNKENEENLKLLNEEYKNINIAFGEFLRHLNKNELKKNKFNEIALMLQEEKEGVDMKIIEYMSLKETYEEIAKLQLKIFIFENLEDNNNSNVNTFRMNLKNENENDNNGARQFLLNNKNKMNLDIKADISDIKVYYYEINIIDINKLSKEMGSHIINLINYYLHSLGSIQNNTEINNSYNYTTINNKASDLQNLDNMNTILDENNKYNTINNFNMLLNKTKIFYNKSDIKSLISILSSKIEKHIINYLASSDKYVEGKNYIDNFEQLFNILNELIISFINIYYNSYIKIKTNYSQKLILFIKYFIKSFYYEKIISTEFSFINHEYKNNNKILTNYINLIEKNLNKLNSQNEENLLKKKQLEEKIKYLNDEIMSKDINLTEKEKEYIKLNQKLKDLNDEKNMIKYELIDYENECNFNNEKLDNKIDDLNNKNILLKKNIISCQEEIKMKNKQYKMEIQKLKKEIKKQFEVIRNQIEVYKKKYGDNIELYNTFINRIDESLRLANMSILTDDNLPKNTQSTFYKSQEKRNLKKNFFTPEKMRISGYNKNLNIY